MKMKLLHSQYLQKLCLMFLGSIAIVLLCASCTSQLGSNDSESEPSETESGSNDMGLDMLQKNQEDEDDGAQTHEEDNVDVPSDINPEVDSSIHTLAIHDISISAGFFHNGVLIDGDLYTWGYNYYGQLGDGTTESRPEPKLVMGLPKVKSICFAGLRSAAIAENGDLYTWGVSETGILYDTYENHTPTKTEGISNVKQIDINESECIALTEEGDVYTWTEGVDTPQRVEGLSDVNVKKVCIGYTKYYGVITVEGDLYTWSPQHYSNEHGELGRSGLYLSKPGLVEGISDVVDIDFGYTYSAAVTLYGELYLWGEGAQVGDGSTSKLKKPGLVPDIPYVKKLCIDHYTYAFITDDGLLYTWGQNEYGNLGFGDAQKMFYNSPHLVPELSGVKEVSMGIEHGIVITDDNTIYVFGENGHGQLGSDDLYYTSHPIIVDFFKDIIK